MLQIRTSVSVVSSLVAFALVQVAVGTRVDAQVQLAGRPLEVVPLPGHLSGAGTPVVDLTDVTGPGAKAAARSGAAVKAARGSAGSTPEERTEAAMRALAGKVERLSHPEALRQAFLAYHNYREARPDRVRKPYFYFVDMGLNSQTPRGYVFDMDQLTIVDGPFAVAHGRGSSQQRSSTPTSFSNRPGSKATSLGIYLAQETYGFSGRSGGRSYRSVGLRLRGESGSFNDAARQRGIVAHGAPYVTARTAGRSEGCPAMEPRRAQRLLPMLANGGVVMIYSPHDTRWLERDPWINTTS